MTEKSKKVEKGSGKEPMFPRRLDIVDMPADVFNVTGNLRAQLCKVVNYSRQYPAKMELVAEMLQYTLGRMEQIAENDKEEAEAKAKERLKRIKAAEKASQEPVKEPEPAAKSADTKAPAPAKAPAKAESKPVTKAPAKG